MHFSNLLEEASGGLPEEENSVTLAFQILYSQNYPVTWYILVDPVYKTADATKHWIKIGATQVLYPTRDTSHDPSCSF